MIRAILFDLGGTLLDAANQPLPGVKTALTAIAKFTASDGKPLRSCLVSNYYAADPPTAAKINARFAEYLQILDQAGLRAFFEPVKKRVTLSTHAQAAKPAAAVFLKALERLGAPKLTLKECLLITEEAAHVKSVHDNFGMAGLQFGKDFDDWGEAPELIADIVAPHQFANTAAALAARLAEDGIEMDSAELVDEGESVNVRGTVWRELTDPSFGDLRGVQATVPVEGIVSRKKKSSVVKSANLAEPTAENIAETEKFVKNLAKHGQIADGKNRPGTFPSHEIKTDADGKRKLVRKGYSAV